VIVDAVVRDIAGSTLHCKVDPWRTPDWWTGLLSEVASARAATTSSYARLWRSEAGSPADLDNRVPEPRHDPQRGAMRDERSPDDVS
jgi:hypothetical protein